MTEFNDLFLPIFLLGVICYWIIWLGSPSKSNLASGSNSASSWGYYHGVLAEGEFCALACLLEDAPIHVLKGQAYDLAIPLMTPLA
ncbi:MAG: J domain-containing protein, partial [Cyanobacteria bacterium J083]